MADEQLDDEQFLACRHFLICRSIWYDPRQSDEFSLGRVIVQITPGADQFPLVVERLFAYCQVFGTPGEYHTRIQLVRIDRTEYNEEVEVPMVLNGAFVMWRSGRQIVVSEDDFVSQFAVTLIQVSFPIPGVYEFQLFLDDAEEPLARERLHIEGVAHEA